MTNKDNILEESKSPFDQIAQIELHRIRTISDKYIKEQLATFWSDRQAALLLSNTSITSSSQHIILSEEIKSRYFDS